MFTFPHCFGDLRCHLDPWFSAWYCWTRWNNRCYCWYFNNLIEMMHSFLVDVFALVRIISEFISQAVLNLGLAISGERNRKLIYRYYGSAVCLKDRSWKHEVRRRKTRHEVLNVKSWRMSNLSFYKQEY